MGKAKRAHHPEFDGYAKRAHHPEFDDMYCARFWGLTGNFYRYGLSALLPTWRLLLFYGRY
jgi:hypothetical protein